MLTDDYSPQEILEHLDPAGCSYQEWVDVGMALHKAGEPCSVWEEWSRRDYQRYHDGECEKKWASFKGAAYNDVTIGTVIKMAMDHGWSPVSKEKNYAIGWDDEITADQDPLKIIDQRWVMEEDVPGPKNFNQVQQLLQYLELLFQPDEYVGFVTEAYVKNSDDPDKPDKYVPGKGSYTRTAGELMQALYACNGDVGSVMGDFRDEYGAWVRFNPLDGKGVSDANVTAFRYALVECDVLPISKQYALIKQLELPVVVLVHSGKKSLHAIVRIDAESFGEYRSRVDYLYKVCEKNGLKLDTNNRNPSRLSRLPGAIRQGRPQYIVASQIGQESWDKWKEFIEAANDQLPDIENFAQYIRNLPELSPELIHGVLRKGHKMLLSGPSKAGKSFALIELCIALAEGREWLGFKCEQGKVLYVNLELDPASCLHRFADVYKALGILNPSSENIDIWNLRGRSEPMDKLAPKMIRRARQSGYTAIVIDPIYKVITGDENSADQMALFCNQFDKLASELECAVIYCHHHSKGSQWGKRAADRASGSGVFARDPDAIIDMLEIEIGDDEKDAMIVRTLPELCLEAMKKYRPDSWQSALEGVDLGNVSAVKKACHEALNPLEWRMLELSLNNASRKIEQRTGWKINGTLREFPSFPDFYAWFDYPVHVLDKENLLDGMKKTKNPKWGSKEAREMGREALMKYKEEEKEKNRNEFITAIDAVGPKVEDVIKYFGAAGLSPRAIKLRATRYGFSILNGEFIDVHAIADQSHTLMSE